ncbi:thioredoxin [Algibacter sp. 2305UL17-15]|uniref:thioredoxin n=1 Tax=Algibacter sp. 2305UL17-15 TaxID=3231268 RepID=UPI00345AE332
MKGNFKDIINDAKPILVDFYATWCGPCKAQSPIISELAKEVQDSVRIIKIDIDKNPQIAEQYQVRGVPTLVLFKNGAMVWRQSGVQSKQQLQKIIDKHK